MITCEMGGYWKYIECNGTGFVYAMRCESSKERQHIEKKRNASLTKKRTNKFLGWVGGVVEFLNEA